MKLVRKKKEHVQEEKNREQNPRENSISDLKSDFADSRGSSWKVLVVDDEPDVHAITRLSLKHFRFADKDLIFLSAMSGTEAREILKENPDIAIALVDVVMETEDAGLRLVRFIREEMHNTMIRLIIRTGQPGAAPERHVIDHYDIDDYKDKTELIAQKLYTAIRSSVKAYRDISIIHRNRQGLEKILKAAPEIYSIQPMEQFFEGVLTQMIGYCNLGNNNLISTINGFLAISDGTSRPSVQAGTGRFAKEMSNNEVGEIIERFDSDEKIISEKSMLIPLKVQDKVRGFIYMEEAEVAEEDMYLIRIMANQCAAALQNLNLYHDLEAANRMNERKNQFLGMAAHDLRNPLSGVEMALNLVQSYPMDKDNFELIKMARVLNQSAIELVSDLLDVAKIESGRLELELAPTDLSQLVKEVLDLNRFLWEPKRIRIEFSAEDSVPEIMLDSERIQQVLTNLISNAVKYSHPGTAVQMNLCVGNEKEAILSVKDQGEGIPRDEIGKLFQPFVKASVKSTGGEQSTGLGLVICKKIVEAHGGRIWLESEVGAGSIFYVSFPFSRLGKADTA